METLREDPEYQISAVGLNRTMQYGNIASDTQPPTGVGLNRTMQYGN